MYISLNTHKYKYDYEYLRIIQELKALGITPSGNKSTDKTRLEIEKNRLIKLGEKENINNKNFLETLFLNQEEISEKNQLEEKRIGATSLAELNRFYFGL